MDLVKTAWRNVRRNRRRTRVTVAAMSLALAVMIGYSGLIDGYLRDLENNLLDLELGDLQVFDERYRGDPDLFHRIEDTTWTLALEEQGFRVSPRLLAWGLVAAEESSAGVSFRGVDPDRDARVSDIHQHVAQGAWLDPAAPKEVVVGRALARMLDVGLGDELVVVSQGADGAGAYDLFRVRGVLAAVGDATDRTGVFLLDTTFRELFVVEEGVHQLVMRRPVERALPLAAADVRARAGALDVQTWRELMPTLASMLDSAEAAVFFMFFIIYLAVAILILNAMLMAVFERVREIGVLKALGVGPGSIFALMGLEAMLQAALAVGIGLALGLPLLFYLSEVGVDMMGGENLTVMGVAMDPIWHAQPSLGAVLRPIAMLVGIVGLAVLVPASRAARIDPVTAIHHH